MYQWSCKPKDKYVKKAVYDTKANSDFIFEYDQSGADPGFGQGGAQVLRPEVGDIEKWSRMSEASNLRPGSIMENSMKN